MMNKPIYDIDVLYGVAEAATPSPWACDHFPANRPPTEGLHQYSIVEGRGPDRRVIFQTPVTNKAECVPQQQKDAEFAATFDRDTVLLMLWELKQNRKKIESLESEISNILDVLQKHGDPNAREWLIHNYPNQALKTDYEPNLEKDGNTAPQQSLENNNQTVPKWQPGDHVEKCTGDYTGPGIVRDVTTLPDGRIRYLVGHTIAGGGGEFLHIYSEANLQDKSEWLERPPNEKGMRGENR